MPRDSNASSKHTDPADDLLDKYSPLKVAKIFPTNYKRKPLVLDTFRPKENQCLDYHLSETNVRWNIGDTKVRAKQIIGDYVLAPPGYVAKKKPVYASGGPPCWKWLDEIWREKIERRQARYKEMFAEYVKNRRTKVIKDKSTMYNFKFKLDCPLWYQELSFRQMAVIENLQWCINTDLQYNIIDNTKENLALLGLMLRANSKGIKIALKYCCGSDVEFLLVLYQISNPNRTDYSINDRLLLSAVYHLCITETLRELHVRIPSPPREGKKKILPELPKRPKRQKFDSPYLEPFTYVRPPPKNTGIFKKNFIQYPESPYFFYLGDLYEEIANSQDPRDIDISEIEDPVILEIIEDMKKAQIMYSRLPHKTYKNIVAPTVKDRCKDIDEFLRRSKKSVMPSEPEPTEPCLPPLAELPPDEEEPCTCEEPGAGEKSDDNEQSEPDEIEPICLPQDIPCGECPEQECDCKALALTHMKSFCKRCIMKKRFKQKIVMNGSRCMEDGTIVPIIGGFYKEKECLCLHRYQSRWQILDKAQKMETEKVKFSISGICYTPAGAFFIVQSVMPQDGPKRRGMDDEFKPCSQAICICEELERMRPKTLVEVPIPELRPSPVMPWELSHCTCKEELKKFLSLQCHCADCEEQQRLANPDYVLGGTKQVICKDSGGGMGEYAVSIPIIQAVQDIHCECLEKYKEHLKKLEEYKQRVKARIVLKAREHKYAIGGVTQTKDGPVYQIQGLRTPLKCICEEVDAEMREEEAQRKRMPKMPPTGRTKYAIGGVYAGTCAEEGGIPEGENLFILSTALGDKPCKCHKLYEVFEEEHKNCMDYFEEYMKKTMDDILAVKMEEAKKRERQRKKEAKLKALEPAPPPEPEEPPDYCLDPCPACQPVCPCIEKPDNFDNISSFRRESDESTGSDLFSVGSNKCTCALEIADEERLKKLVPCEPCNEEMPPVVCPPEAAPEPTPEPEEPEDNEIYDLKRFVILDKIPCDDKEMLEIVTKVLATMADDGFPLAKLPECHKLPIFKLWIYLRCGKCWRWEERPPFNVLNKILTKKAKNTSILPLPTIPISVRKAAKLTWIDARYVKAMMEDLKEGFYRKIRQTQIEGMRAFFPAIFNYEFPEMRHTFFCYLPSKEEGFCFLSQ